jgi:hypothetical protein
MPAKALPTCLLAAALVLAVAPSQAHADDDKKVKSLTLGTVGFGIGAAEIADISGTAVGLHLDLGRSFGDFHLQGEYWLGGFTETRPDYTAGRGALLQRVGVLARWQALNKFFGYRKFRVNVWLEAGVAREFWQWTEGGKLDRDLYTLGFGTGFLGNLGSDSKHRWLGAYYDFRFTLAESPYAGKDSELVGCAGPCEEPTPPVPIDFGFMFVLGFNFGR